mmetsp:Transcript_78037/g.168747  ORF Transcript_78037/g.168747 Transcript_78037/m.168747 type:complete len:210 (-) Transcript_78037:133-762(-)
MITVRPQSSLPLRPARPDIWMNSLPEMVRLMLPSNFSNSVKTTVLAGMLTPIAKVSVVNRIFTKFSWNNISVISLTMGKSPPWWMPIPFNRNSLKTVMDLSSWSSMFRVEIARFHISSTMLRSRSDTSEKSLTSLARSSHLRLLKLKQIAGKRLSCFISESRFVMSLLRFCFLPSLFSNSLLTRSKCFLLNFFSSSQIRNMRLLPLGYM